MPVSPNSNKSVTPDGRCQHLRADGKRCTSTTYPGHAALCHHHLGRQMRGISDADTVAADILSSVGNFQSVSALNLVLGKLLVHQLTGRIARQEALAIAYNCQLLLQTVPAVKEELEESGYGKYWHEETARILSRTSDIVAVTSPSLLPQSSLALRPPAVVFPPDPATAAQPPATPPTTASPQTTPASTTPLPSTPAEFAAQAVPPK